MRVQRNTDRWPPQKFGEEERLLQGEMETLAFGAVQGFPCLAGRSSHAPSCLQRKTVTAVRRGTMRTRAIPAPEYGPNQAGGSGVGSAPEDEESDGSRASGSKGGARKAAAAKKGGAPLASAAKSKSSRGGAGGSAKTRVASVARKAQVAARKQKPEALNGSQRIPGGQLSDSGIVPDGVDLEPVRKTGFNAPVIVTRALADLLSHNGRVMTRPQVASRISEYVAEHDLSCKDDGRYFTPDAALRALFPDAPERIKFSKITAHLRSQVTAPSECNDVALVEEAEAAWTEYVSSLPLGSRVVRKVDRRGRTSASFQGRMRDAGKGLYSPVVLSTALSKICEGETVSSRPEVTRRVWIHIKNLGLQDGHERRMVHTDPLLKELCGDNRDLVDCFELSKYIARNLTAHKDVVR